MGLLDGIGRAVSDDIIKMITRGGARDRLEGAYLGRSELMHRPQAQRPQPNPDRQRYIDSDYAQERPGIPAADLDYLYPRNPDPSAKLPKGDRARVLVDAGSEISDALGQRIAATGQMDQPTRYFYHSDGPIYRGAREAGLSHEEATAYVESFGQFIAATSPRTNTTQNVQNATSVMAKQAQGIPHREIVGPGSGGISERGYPMMTGPGSHIGTMLDTVIEGGRLNPRQNPKPSNFASNVSGNRDSATMDTHAIRGILQTLNEIQPGAVPEGFILPPHRLAYADNPGLLTPDMVDDSLGSQKIGGVSMQTEYPVFADIMHGAADQLGVSPAETQSMAWFGFGDQTNLGSDPKTLADLFDERLDVTAQALGLPVEEVARMVYRRQIPLFEMAGAGLGGGLLAAGAAEQGEPSLEDYLRSIGAY